MLLNPGAALFWSEHSTRAVLPSWGAALNFTGEELDYIGRWSPQGSDTYVRTSRSVVLRLHKEIADKVRRSVLGADLLGEGHLAERLALHLVSRGWPASRAEEYSVALCSFDPDAHREAAQDTPFSFIAPTNQASDSEEFESCFDFPFAVLTAKKGSKRCLHKQGGCGRLDPARFNLAGYQDLPADDQYDTKCRRCWRDNQEANGVPSSSSSSASSSASS
jgi:hypothetical protein